MLVFPVFWGVDPEWVKQGALKAPTNRRGGEPEMPPKPSWQDDSDLAWEHIMYSVCECEPQW